MNRAMNKNRERLLLHVSHAYVYTSSIDFLHFFIIYSGIIIVNAHRVTDVSGEAFAVTGLHGGHRGRVKFLETMTIFQRCNLL